MEVQKSKTFRSLTLAACVLPATVLSAAYTAICFYTRNPWPWNETVHESGNRTLLGTIFYYQHAARELPLDIILGVAVAGSVLFLFPSGNRRNSDIPPASAIPASGFHRGAFGLATLIILGTIVGGTLWAGGITMLRDNLAQLQTRPGAQLVWGAHWRYHLLSRLTLMLVSFGFAGLVVLTVQGKRGAGEKSGLLVVATALGLFALLSVVFSLNGDPFFDPVFLGHQVRETFTHLLVTLPIAWATCLVLARDNWDYVGTGTVSVLWPVLAGVAGSLTGLYLLAAGLDTSAASQGQTQNVILLICPHFFEHTFSYFVVALVAGLTYGSTRSRRRTSPPPVSTSPHGSRQ